jgi:hypothetical protein
MIMTENPGTNDPESMLTPEPIQLIHAKRHSRSQRTCSGTGLRARILPVLTVSALAASCLQGPQTIAEKQGGYTYVPLDPFPVLARTDEEYEVLTELAKRSDNQRPAEILSLFPDNAARFSIERIDSQGRVTYGTSEVSAKGQVFRVTTDYTSSDTANLTVLIGQYVLDRSLDAPKPSVSMLRPLSYPLARGEVVVGYNVETYDTDVPATAHEDKRRENMDLVNIPIYIGIGLRITADLVTLDSKAKVDGLGVIGAEAEASRVRGSMVIQTLGINGKSIAAALPIQNELNRTTIYNAASAIGAIKALIHENETTIYPRIVGLYLPFRADKALVNEIISELSANPPEWRRLKELGLSRFEEAKRKAELEHETTLPAVTIPENAELSEGGSEPAAEVKPDPQDQP